MCDNSLAWLTGSLGNAARAARRAPCWRGYHKTSPAAALRSHRRTMRSQSSRRRAVLVRHASPAHPKRLERRAQRGRQHFRRRMSAALWWLCNHPRQRRGRLDDRRRPAAASIVPCDRAVFVRHAPPAHAKRHDRRARRGRQHSRRRASAALWLSCNRPRRTMTTMLAGRRSAAGAAAAAPRKWLRPGRGAGCSRSPKGVVLVVVAVWRRHREGISGLAGFTSPRSPIGAPLHGFLRSDRHFFVAVRALQKVEGPR